jgi:hypothetical protein
MDAIVARHAHFDNRKALLLFPRRKTLYLDCPFDQHAMPINNVFSTTYEDRGERTNSPQSRNLIPHACIPFIGCAPCVARGTHAGAATQAREMQGQSGSNSGRPQKLK